MSTTLIDNFSYRGRRFLDARQSVDTLGALQVMPEADIPDGFRCYCKQNGRWYEYNSANEVKYPGRWRPVAVTSDNVFDRDSGDTVKDQIAHLNRNPIFCKVTGVTEKSLQAIFTDASIPTLSNVEDVYYAFGIVGPTRIALYAVDKDGQNRPEWNNTYIRLVTDYTISIAEDSEATTLTVRSNNGDGSYIVLDVQKFKELVTSDKTSLWAWVIDPKYYHVNNTSLKLEKLESGLNAVVSQINQVSGDINEISYSEPDPDKAVCQLIQDTIAGMVVGYPSSTFAGFCRSIGKVDSVFSAVQIPVICRSYSGSTTPIKEITIVFYEIKNGAWDQELFRKTFGIEPVNPKETFDGILNLGRNLDLTQYDEVGIGYYTDSYSSPYRSSKLTSTEGLTAPARYTSLGWNSWSLISGSPKFEGMYFRLYKGLDRIVKVPSTVVDSIKDKVIGELGAADRTIDVSLPDKIYAVVGDKLQIFYRGCVKAVNPYNYDILVTCAKGKQFPRYFEYTPTTDDIGTTSFSITVKDDNGNILGTKSCELVTVANNPTVASSKTILCFGDSLTASGLWCKTADERLPSNILFKGGKTVDSTGYFGVGGWTWDSYTTQGRPAVRFNVSGVASLSLNAVYTNNGVNYTVMEINVTDGTGNILCGTSNASVKPTGSTLTKSSGEGDAGVTFSAWSDDTQNPLWKDGAMTFVPYVDKYCGGTVDFVYTLLSWNGQSPHKTDFSAVIAQITNFARTLHSEYPGAKLKIMGVQVPSVTGGMGANYGATGTSYADTYGMVVTALNQNKAYQDFCNQDEFKSYCEFVNVSSQFDSEYNMPYAVRPVNSRWSDASERIGINGVHPSEAGYQQIGDIVYRNLMAQFS